MSLHDELNRPYEEEEEEEIFTADPLSSMTNGVENLEFENSAVVKDEEDTFDDSVDKSDKESDDDQVHTSTPRKVILLCESKLLHHYTAGELSWRKIFTSYDVQKWSMESLETLYLFYYRNRIKINIETTIFTINDRCLPTE